MDIQNMYDNLLQEVYRDILQKERFAGKRGNFVQTENGLVRSVRFASWHEKNDTITFRISVEVRFEKEALLRREGKIAGQGCYREYFPKMPGWSGQAADGILAKRTFTLQIALKSGDRRIWKR